MNPKRVTITELNKEVPVLATKDTNVAGKPTGYWVYSQSDNYAIDDEFGAERLRRLGYTVRVN